MTLRTRRRIFYTLVLLFILIGGGVVAYAQGWRLDFATWRFEKVGAIYVRAYPANASIFLNGKPVQNQTGFLSSGTFISDLLPRTYNVSLKVAGYDDWQENAAVLPAVVVPFKYAVLIPQDGMPVPTSTASSTLKQLGIDRSDPNQKIVAGPNKISIFDVAQGTTTIAVKVPGKNLVAKWVTGNLIGILQNDGELYLYDTSAQSLRKLADDVVSFSLTEDGSMVAALEHKSLEVFSLNDPTIYYRFNLPNITAAKSIIWYKDRTHLFVVYPDHVSFLDLADTSLINFTTVGMGTSPLYDRNTNVLYLTAPNKTLVQYVFTG